MCGRFNAAIPIEVLQKIFQAVQAEEACPGSHNVAPTESVPVVIEGEDQERRLRCARFGTTITVQGKTFPLINLQSEKAVNRSDFKTRRCIIPAAGFYEWEKITPKEKQPYYFSPREGVLAFAGVWSEGKEGLAFSIFTTAANDVVGPIHGRMPVILGHNAVGQWLAKDSDPAELFKLMEPHPDALIQSWKVSKTVNSPKNKDAACINSL